jgi:hypothetical protein
MVDVFVYIVESPGADDIFDGRSEGEALAASLKIVQRPHATRTAITRDQFRRAFSLNPADGGVGLEVQRHNGAIPLVHLSMHGNQHGVGLADGSFLSWANLFEELDELNASIPAGIHLGLSSCHGYHALKQRFPNGTKPPFAVVGTPDLLPWADGLVAFTTYYHLWFRGDVSWSDTIGAMRAASGHASFDVDGWPNEDWGMPLGEVATGLSDTD